MRRWEQNIYNLNHLSYVYMKQWAKAGQINGSKIIVQINHPGKQSPKTVSKHPVSPSAIPLEGDIKSFFNKPRVLSLKEIKDLIKKFATAAKIAKESGIDFIEISGGSYEKPKMNEMTSKNKDNVFFVNYSKKIKEKVQTPVIVTGGILTEETMIDLIENGYSDFIGLARALVIEPNIPNLIKEKFHDVIEKRISIGIKSLDKKLGVVIWLVYYQVLMQNYAKGKKSKIITNAWGQHYYIQLYIKDFLCYHLNE